MKKILFLFLLHCFGAATVFAQKDIEVEYDYKEGYVDFQALPLDTFGVLLTYKKDETKGDGARDHGIDLLDTNFKLKHTIQFSVPTGFILMETFHDQGVAYSVFINYRNKYIVAKYALATNKIDLIEVEIDTKGSYSMLSCKNNKLVVVNTTLKSLFVNVVDLKTKNNVCYDVKTFKGIVGKTLEFSDLQYNQTSKELIVMFKQFAGKEIASFVRIFADGKVSEVYTFGHEKKFRTYGYSVGLSPEGKVMATGYYTHYKPKMDDGLFVATFDNANTGTIKLHSSSSLPNLQKVFGERIYSRKNKPKYKYISGKTTTHPLVFQNDGVLLLTECYHITTRRVHHGTGKNAYTTTEFDGYQYTHTNICKLSFSGDILWEHSFVMHINYKPFTVKHFATLFANPDGSCNLGFNDNLMLFDRKISASGIIESDLKRAAIKNTNLEGDNVKGAISFLEPWYKGYYLGYGIQRVKNKENEDVAKRRWVFYLMKSEGAGAGE